MTTSSAVEATRRSPDAIIREESAFYSWPESGLPEGYFRTDALDGVSTFFDENGWLVLHEALGEDALEGLIRETTKLARNEDGTIDGVEPAGAGVDDDEAMRRILCVHFPHKISKVFHDALSCPPVVDVLTRVVGPNVKCMQSMLFIKASGKPGQAWHQDEDYIPTRDRSLIGAWIALDDATIKNGCLWILSGSHKPGVLWPQHFHNDRRFDCARESFNFPFSDEDSVPVEVKKGSIVFFNGYTLHRSLPNIAEGGYRRALVNHYMSAESLLPWRKPEDVHMAIADYRDIVMVAGEDPHAWKGIEDLAKVTIRPSGEGGCEKWGGAEKNDEAVEEPAGAAGK